MISENLVAERIAIESYREIIQYLQGKDHTSRRLLESILAVEEEHAEELSSMLHDLHDLLPDAMKGIGARGGSGDGRNLNV